jgi:hypothetical protein
MSTSRLSTYVLLLSFATAAPAATFTVGSDAACTHSNLLAAISAASGNGLGGDEIRVATNQTYANQITT